MADEKLNKTTAQAENFEEFKAIKRGDKVPAEVAPTESSKPGEQSSDGGNPPSAEEGKPEGGTPPPQSQTKRDRSVNGRMSEIAAERNKEKERADRLERENAELRGSRPAPSTQPAIAPQPAPPPVSAQPSQPPPQSNEAIPERPNKKLAPKLTDYTANPKPGETYEAAQERWLDDREKWARTEAAEEQRWTEAVNKDRTHKAKVNQGVALGRAKYADFDAKTAGDPQAMTGLVLRNETWKEAIEEIPAWHDVVYELAKDPAETARVAKLSHTRQMAELYKIEARLTAGQGSTALPPVPGAQPSSEPRKPPISRVSPPGHSVGGGAAGGGAPTKTSEAENYRAYKQVAGRPSARR